MSYSTNTWILTCLLSVVGCRTLPKDHNDSDIKETAPEASEEIAKFNPLNFGQDQDFTRLVDQADYASALALVCKRFSLDCRLVSYAESKAVAGESTESAKAVTYPYTNKVHVYKAAFVHQNQAHPGWLAAIILHELVHTRQSQYVRAIVLGAQARILADHTYEAGLELEAWLESIKHAKRLSLNCPQRLEIEDNIHFYQTILNRHGRWPSASEEQEYQLPADRASQIFRRCLSDIEKEQLSQ
jgi:hypothetical protein